MVKEAGVEILASAARSVPTFKEAAALVRKEHSGSWRNGKHGAQWLSTLETHACPVIGSRRLDQIEAADILKVLSPIWLGGAFRQMHRSCWERAA